MRTVEDLGDLTQLQKEPRPLQLGEWRPVQPNQMSLVHAAPQLTLFLLTS